MNLSHGKAINHKVIAVYLTASDLKVACSLLYQAYRRDPVFSHIFEADVEGYEARLRAAIREELNAFWEAGQAIVGLFAQDRLLAVACLVSSDAAFGSGRLWHWRLKMLLTAGYSGTMQLLAKEEKLRQQVPAEHYHVLSFIGVLPSEQHHGLGQMLLAAVESAMLADELSEGIAVFATLQENKQFFRGGCYQLVKSIDVGAVGGHLMFRWRHQA